MVYVECGEMELRRSTKYIFAGILLVIAGFVLNLGLVWFATRGITDDWGDTPPPIVPYPYTVFLFLVPLGLILLVYGLFLRWAERRREKPRNRFSTELLNMYNNTWSVMK
ncbi:hypothetical protein EU546_03855 [Candidatus Thorarchaeota archaeon]|nr:MAG: hypothetical protein EU546_03855 [Candidatus Thorarchaeota archaeon]